MWRTSVETHISPIKRKGSLSPGAKMKCVFHTRMDSGILYGEEIEATLYGHGINRLAGQTMNREISWSTTVYMI